MTTARAAAGLGIEIESAGQAEVALLVRQSDAYLATLYPPTSRHAIDLEALAAPNVRLLVARIDGVAAASASPSASPARPRSSACSCSRRRAAAASGGR